MIKQVMEEYFPGWEPPDEDDYREWIPTECPVHGDSNPSASVSYEHNAFMCHACGYSGDYIRIIEKEDNCSYAEAVEKAETIAARSGVEVPRKSPGKSRRGVPKFKRFGS